MKNNLLIRLIVLSTASIFFSGAYSQLSSEKDAASPKSSSAKPLAPGTDADKMALEGIKAVNVKMFNHFTRNFKNATDIHIGPLEENTQISFKIDGINHNVQYNKKGNWRYTVRTFEEGRLPDDLRNDIEEYYPGFRVFGFVTEVNVLDKSATLVMIENKTSWKRVRIVNDEIDVYESYTKQLK